MPNSRYNSELKSFFKGNLLSYFTGVYIVVWYLQLSKRVSIFESVRFEFLLGAFLTIFSILAVSTQKESKIIDSNWTSPLIRSLYYVIAVLGVYAVFSIDRSNSIDIYIDRVIKFSALTLFLTASVRNVHDLRVIFVFLLISWLKLGSEGFIGWITGSMMWYNQGIPRLHGATGVLFHPNSFSGFAVGCLPFCVFLLKSGVESKVAKISLIVLLVFSLIIIVNTGSRTGYVAVVIGLSYLFLRMKNNKTKSLVLLLLVVLASIQFVPEYYKGRFISIFTLEEAEGDSSGARLEIIRDAVQVILTHPFGTGLNSFPTVRKEMFGRSQDTHNLYLELFTNVGPLGTILFLYFIVQIIKLNNKNIERSRRLLLIEPNDSLNLKFCASLAYAINGFLVMRLILGMFGMDLYEIYWWLAAGLTLAVSNALKAEAAQIDAISTKL